MANGQRRGGGPSRNEETRIAPEEDPDATRDIPLVTRAEETLEPDPLVTRMTPLDAGPDVTRMGPVEDRPVRGARARGGVAPPARDARGEETDPGEFATDIRSEAPAAVRGGPAPKSSGWLAKGAGEKRASPPPAQVGVVRLSPLEPAKGKAALEDEPPALRTMFANHSALLAEQLRGAMSSKMYGRGPHRVLRIDEPEGPSTAGGKLARQAISLVPRKGSGPSLMCGWVDVSKREAQLRNFEAVAKRYESHHGEPLEMQAEEYERFLRDVEEVLTQAVIKVRIIVPEEGAGAVRVAPVAGKTRRKGVPVLLTVALAVVAFLLGVFVGRMPG
ncbi:hypothetical protein HPC49_13345 [Pyxidicoccus fallax]|uniref:Uncharacterized protein n=1 Tax=Pyxidicoccus fallax TaxID=394095 RepID=A0A848L9X3_9BACT|nr:hypothetical protein [Pyxidicoccus fallax]NMO15377.1 hypothetical protein [Pyxidicoccus fallax]NPC79219.1 hypothetical protein [Pyxidicoccus fallax]